MTFGVVPTGFAPKTFDDVRTELRESIKTKLGASVAVDIESSVIGMLTGVVADMIAENWATALAVYMSAYRSTAAGASLDQVLAISGITRLAARKSTASVVAVGTNGTVLAIGRRVKNAVTQSVWTSTQSVTITTLSARAPSTAYASGDLRTSSGNIYSCTVAGTSSAGAGPSGTGTAIADGSCTWRYIASGSAAVAMPVESLDYGVIIGAAGNLTVIDSPTGGWSNASNPLDAVVGRNVETDAEARVRAEALIQNSGAGDLNAVRAKILTVSGVTSCTIFVNTTDAVDGNGIPGHSFEAVVEGGSDQAIRDAIFSVAPITAGTSGNTVGTVTDSTGTLRPVLFTRPTLELVYMTIDVTVIGAQWPVDGADQVKAAVVALGNSLDVGADVVRSQFFAPVDGVAGTNDITNIRLGFTASPSGTSNLAISNRSRASFDTSRVVVNVTVV